MKILISILILFFSVFSARGQEIVKLSTVDFPPYSYSEGQIIKGIEVDIVKKIFDDQGIKYVIELVPFPRALKSVEDGERDFIFNFYKNPDRLTKFDYSDPILENPLVLFVKKDKNVAFTGRIEELKGYNIGTMLGYTYSPEFDKARKEKFIKTEEVSGHESNFQKLSAGRIDIYIVEKNVGLFIIKKLDLKGQFKYLNVPLKVQQGFMGISKKNHRKALLGKINAGLRALKASGEYQKIFDRYLK